MTKKNTSVVGVTKERLLMEKRVALVPADVKKLVDAGIQVLVEADAGKPSGFSNQDYVDVGAEIVTPEYLFSKSSIVVKVKQPIEMDFDLGLNRNNTLFSYLHYEGDDELQKLLLDHRITSYAFESVRDDSNRHVLLEPMSKIAGRLSYNFALEVQTNWAGKLLNNTPGFGKTNVMVIGLGNAGMEAARLFHKSGCNVWGYDNNRAVLDKADAAGITTFYSTNDRIYSMIKFADVVICAAVGNPTFRSPVILTDELKSRLSSGTVVVDIAIDQGGNVSGIKKTSLANKYNEVSGVAYVAIPNMPGCVPKTASVELSSVLYKYVQEMASTTMYTGTRFYDSITTIHGHRARQMSSK